MVAMTATPTSRCTFAPNRSRISRLGILRLGVYRLRWITSRSGGAGVGGDEYSRPTGLRAARGK
ncbi:hypothetical protein BJP40_12105 [Streptomyces sp. CC53]|nr:hypothetical protein BJP40_12105 [Streptomyces sp. CC53]